MSFVGDNFSLELQANVNWNSIGSSHLKLKPRGLRIRRGAPCFFSWEVGVGRTKGEIKSNSIIFWLLFVLTLVFIFLKAVVTHLGLWNPLDTLWA